MCALCYSVIERFLEAPCPAAKLEKALTKRRRVFETEVSGAREQNWILADDWWLTHVKHGEVATAI